MRLGSKLDHTKHGPVEVCGLTAATVTYKLANGLKRMERRKESRKWRLGDACLVTPDSKNGNRKVRGAILAIRGRAPSRVILRDDPVWGGCELYVETGVKVERV